ncbi:MAG TPA: CBS domain-containing protein [Gemmataceae bacterium]|jgi:CBS domain-containing protein
MNVKQIMTDNPACCTRSTKLTDVARMLVENDCGAIPVVDDMDRRNPVGVITDRDIVCRAIAQGKDPARTTAGECMSTELVCVTVETDVDEAARQMTEHQVRRVLVTDKDRHLCGIVAQADVARKAGKNETAKVVQGVSA